jgi:hypothetical protein
MLPRPQLNSRLSRSDCGSQGNSASRCRHSAVRAGDRASTWRAGPTMRECSAGRGRSQPGRYGRNHLVKQCLTTVRLSSATCN